MIVLAIDPGTRCGYAVRGAHGAYDSGTWDLSPKRFEGGGMRFVRLRSSLRELLNLAKPDVVAFEEVRRHMGVDAAHIYGGIVAVIQEECEARAPKTPYYGIPVATVKRKATGKGNADKAAMLDAAGAMWPGDWPWSREHEADARWIAETAWAEFGGSAQRSA